RRSFQPFHDAERPAIQLPTCPPGGQGSPVRRSRPACLHGPCRCWGCFCDALQRRQTSRRLCASHSTRHRSRRLPRQKGHSLPPGPRSGRKSPARSGAPGKPWTELSLEEFRRISPAFDTDVANALQLAAALQSKNVPGGTAENSVRTAISQLEQKLKSLENKP